MVKLPYIAYTVLLGFAFTTAHSQFISGTFDFTQGTNGSGDFTINEAGGELGSDGNVITATFNNFQGIENFAYVDGNGVAFDKAGTMTYSFDVTFSNNIDDLVITSYTSTNSTGEFTSTHTLSIGGTSGLNLDDGSPTTTYPVSISATAGSPITFSESSGPGNVSGEAAIGQITFEGNVVPEPSTYALITGALVLAVMVRRRIRQ